MTDPQPVERQDVKARRAAGRLKFGGIEAGRGLAALGVVVAHTTTIMAEPRFYGRLIWDGFAGPFGMAGVDFFFVLSGFIIAWVHWEDLGRPDRIGRYVSRRFRRIYPAYWAVLFPLSALYFLNPGAGVPSQHDPLNFLFSAALLPYPEPPILGVAWTLVHEILFYVLFGMLIVGGRRMLWLVPVWIAGIVWAAFWYDRTPFPASIFLSAFNLEFLIGTLAALWLRSHETPAPRLLAVAGVGAFLALVLLPPRFLDAPLLPRLAFGISALTAIVGIVEWERRYGLKVAAPLRVIGAASYSIYLVHGVALSICLQILMRVGARSIPLPVAFVMLTAAAVLAGVVFHRLVEAPLSQLKWPGRSLAELRRSP